MDHLAILKSAGAQCVAGSLLLNRETVGLFRHGQFLLTPEGEAAVNRLNAEKAPEPAKAPAPPKAAKAKKAEAPAPAADADPASDLDSLLTTAPSA